MANRHMKNAQEKCKLKPQEDVTSPWSEWLSSINQQIASAGEDAEEREASCTVGGNADWYSHCRNQCGDTSKN